MKLISWNVNGLRACIQKGFLEFFNQANADFFCLQETKLQAGQIALELPGYEQYWCYAQKKGYSGTAVFTKHTPMSVRYGLNIPELDTEGRLITLEYPEFYLVTCYTPNAQRELARIDHRLKWEDALRSYLTGLDNQKPVILCGDLNVAHQPIDLKNPAANRGNAGFSDQERSAFSRLLDCGFTDTFRYQNPEATGCYTWWSYMFNARKNNAGWRIDYFLVSDRMRERIHHTPIHSGVLGSDHCPVELDLDMSCNGSIWQSDPEGAAVQVKAEALPISGNAKKVLLSGTACLLLALSFAAGFFTNQLFNKPQQKPNPQYSNLLSSSLTNSGVPIIIESYPAYASSDEAVIRQITATKAKQLTTDELINLAVQIPELILYSTHSVPSYFSSVITPAKLDPDYFNALKNEYPVLAELEIREDAGRKMLLRLYVTSSPTYRTKVLSLLLTLDVFQIEDTALDLINNAVVIPVTPTGE